MPQTIYTASHSEAKVNEETIDGLQSIDYRVVRNRHDIGAVGTNERVAVYYGLTVVIGRLRVASANAKLDKLMTSGDAFSITAVLKRGSDTRNVTFDECFCETKSFGMNAESHAQTVSASARPASARNSEPWPPRSMCKA